MQIKKYPLLLFLCISLITLLSVSLDVEASGEFIQEKESVYDQVTPKLWAGPDLTVQGVKEKYWKISVRKNGEQLHKKKIRPYMDPENMAVSKDYVFYKVYDEVQAFSLKDGAVQWRKPIDELAVLSWGGRL